MDRSDEHSAFAWIMSGAVGVLVAGGIGKALLDKRRASAQREAIEALVPDAERQTRVTLALREVVNREGLAISQDEVEQEVERLLGDYEAEQRPSVAVFVRDTGGKADPPVKLAQQLFQLTPAETSLAIQLANGLSLEEAAEALNIRRNTARAHLRSIFSKTGVRRQTELVRIFLNSVAWLGNK